MDTFFLLNSYFACCCSKPILQGQKWFVFWTTPTTMLEKIMKTFRNWHMISVRPFKVFGYLFRNWRILLIVLFVKSLDVEWQHGSQQDNPFVQNCVCISTFRINLYFDRFCECNIWNYLSNMIRMEIALH